MSLLSVDQDVSASSFFSADHELLVPERRRPKAGFLIEVDLVSIIVTLLADTFQVAIPHIASYSSQTSAPAMIGPTVGNITATRSTDPASKEKTKIISRSGLERLGRFQHGTINYLVELSSLPEPTVLNITSEDILDHMTLQELERFENSQFEKELVYEDPLLVHPKKRGRPPKTALVSVGLSSDDSVSDVIDDGIAVVIPSFNPRKRPHSSALVRRRGRPRKALTTNSPTVSAPSKRALRVEVPTKSSTKSLEVSRPSLLPTNSHHADEDGPLDAASSQLLADANGCEDQSGNIRQDSLPARTENNSKFKTSSALVAAALSTQSEEKEDLNALQQTFAARKVGPDRSRNSSAPSTSLEDSHLETAHQAHKPGRPRKETSNSQPKGTSSTEDELSSLHQKFGASARQTAKSLGTNKLSSRRTARQRKTSSRSIKPNGESSSNTNTIKPRPCDRPGYRLPSLSKNPLPMSDDATSDSELSASPPRTGHQSSLFTQKKAASAPIEISDDESSDSLVAVSSHLQSDRKRIPKPFNQSRQAAAPSFETRPKAMTSRRVLNPIDQRTSKSAGHRESQSSEDEEEDDDMLALDFPIADIPSSQSYVAHPSTSSSETDRRERVIRKDEIARTQRAGGSPFASDRRLSKASKMQPDLAVSEVHSIHSSQHMNRERKSHPVPHNAKPTKVNAQPHSQSAATLSAQNMFSISIGLRPTLQASSKNSFSSSNSGSASSDDSSMIATIKKNPSLFDRLSNQASRPRAKNTTSAAPKSTQTFGAPQRHTPSKAPSTEPRTASSRPFLPYTKSKMQSKPQPLSHEPPSSPLMSIPPKRQPFVSLSSLPQRREASLSLGESPPPLGREASISLGETPSPPRRTITPQTKSTTPYTGARADLSVENTPLRQFSRTPQTAIKNGKAEAEKDEKQVEHSDKKTGIKHSMTPLYPGLPGMPVQKKRTMFGIRKN